MDPSTRGRIVAVVAAAAHNTRINSVFCFREGRLHRVAATVRNGFVTGFDADDLTLFSGTGIGYGFYDLGTMVQVELELNGAKFEGQDLKSSTFFHGIVDAQLVILYDRKEGELYEFGFRLDPGRNAPILAERDAGDRAQL